MQNVSWNQDDPVNRVYFYKKETPWKAVRGGELFGHDDQQTFSPNPKPSDLVIPWKFEEKTTLVYSPERKRKSTQRYIDFIAIVASTCDNYYQYYCNIMVPGIHTVPMVK